MSKTPINKKSKNFIEKINPEVSKSIADPLRATIEAGTGVLSPFRSIPGFTSLSNVLQGTINNGFWKSLTGEFERLRENGKISDEYLSSQQAQYTLAELLEYFDRNKSSKETFELLKNIYLRTAINNIDDKDVKPVEYMKVIKDIPSGALLILVACYSLKDKPQDEHPVANQNGDIFTDDWRKIVSSVSGLDSYDLVCNYEDLLMTKRLLSNPKGGDKVYVTVSNFRLSDLAFLIMKMAEELPPDAFKK